MNKDKNYIFSLKFEKIALLTSKFVFFRNVLEPLMHRTADAID